MGALAAEAHVVPQLNYTVPQGRMGSWTSLSVNGFDLIDSKSFVLDEVMLVFGESDRSAMLVSVQEDLSQVVLGPWEGNSLEAVEDDQQITIKYSVPTGIAAARLDVMGITPAYVRHAFDTGIAAERQRLSEWLVDSPLSAWVEEAALLPSYSFDVWCDEFRYMATETVDDLIRHLDNSSTSPPHSEFSRFFSNDFSGGFWNGFPTDNPRVLLRAAIEALGLVGNVEQDISSVVHAGYYRPDQPVAAEARTTLLSHFPSLSPVVILTEGNTDTLILSQALRVLYPHLESYVRFMDFEAAKVPGGAGALVAVVKSFAGAGIANRIVALFDNDTAGRSAARVLGRISLPPHITVLHLPAFELAENYPTIGPTGPSHANVNGLAGGIELYLGRDVLGGETGDLMPVQWRGYDATMAAYQGELLDKEVLHRRFQAKAEAAIRSSEIARGQDWSGLHLILSSVFSAVSGCTPAA